MTRKTVYKYPLNFNLADGETRLMLATPKGSFKPLTIQLQYEVATLWAEVDVPEGGWDFQTMISRAVYLVGTGHQIPWGCEYAGTLQFKGGTLVLHVYVDARPSVV